ncbi:uncharacterized protein LOC122404126 [Colletes gigas]|uniref:uncharacterized protein LOC122404126 n=1 Tax=Colletes gigas TaxID=935657 RepID=UPI001C9AB118|nr:uncharacterized protein LOC122404126 [Colletes gigas]XP_043263970.1 uncharacterized protein LOC122404126 [Colletes gigas]
MILFTRPRIRILNERKIHVCRKPGFIAWSLLGLSTIIFIEIVRHLSDSFLYPISLLLGQIMFSLDAFGEWQDLLLDKDMNNVVIKKYSWTDNLYSKAFYDSCIVMKLNDIRYVGVSVNTGLFIINQNGETISLSMQGFAREELQKLKGEINHFLNVNKIKLLVSVSKNSLNRSFSIASNTDCIHCTQTKLTR